MNDLTNSEWIYDWNQASTPLISPGTRILLNDETLRDGLQNPSVYDPSIGEKIELVPEKEFAEEIDPETFGGLQPEDIRVHEANWFDSIRANKLPNANIELAIRVQTVISLAEMANRLNLTCLYDEKTRKITTGDGRELKPITYGTLPLS